MPNSRLDERRRPILAMPRSVARAGLQPWDCQMVLGQSAANRVPQALPLPMSAGRSMTSCRRCGASPTAAWRRTFRRPPVRRLRRRRGPSPTRRRHLCRYQWGGLDGSPQGDPATT